MNTKAISKEVSNEAALPSDSQVKASGKIARRQFSVKYKLDFLERYDACEDALTRGALLRKEGLYHSRVSAWRKQRDDGLLQAGKSKKSSSSLLTKQRLQRDNAQLQKKLAKTQSIIDLQKKVLHLLEQEMSTKDSTGGGL